MHRACDALILVVEDHATSRTLLENLLHDQGYRVLGAETGAQALEFCAAHLPDLVLLDILLPDMDGYTVFRRLKRERATATIPVCFVTALDTKDDEERGLSLGAADYMTKPYKPGILLRRIGNIIEVSRTRKKLERQAADMAATNLRIIREVEKRRRAEVILQRRNAVLQAVSSVTETFIQQPDLDRIAHGVLERLARAVGAHRAFLVQHRRGHECDFGYQWDQAGKLPPYDRICLFEDCGHLRDLLGSGRPVCNILDEQPQRCRNALMRKGFGSCLMMPVFTGDEWWGSMIFVVLDADFTWSKPVVDAISVAAGALGSSLQASSLNQERLRLAGIIEQFADCVLMTDCHGTIIYANPACSTLTGCRPGDFVGEHISLLREGCREDTADCQIMEAIRGQKIWRGTISNRRANGDAFEEAVLVLPLRDVGGELNRFAIIRHDITEQRRLESIAEAANLMDNIGFIFVGLRHELGNPVNSLKMTLSVMARRLEQLPPDKMRGMLERALEQIGRIEYLLRTMRSFSFVEKQEIGRVDMSAFLARFYALHQDDLAKQGVELTMTVDAENCCAYVDERALHQVLLNLVTNAISALEGRPNPHISIVLSRPGPGWLRLSVCDNGRGISAENLKKLFRPFFTTRAQGTGLGLAIVRKMLAEMNCTITFDSQVDVGTTVTIILPEYLGEEERDEPLPERSLDRENQEQPGKP